MSVLSETPAAAHVRPRVAIRPIALPTEHGGWGFLFEPMILGLAVAPSRGGFLLALAALFGFLARQPLRLALQDALRGRSYPRTVYCRSFAAGYAAAALSFVAAAVAVSGPALLVPFALVAPLALVQVVYDAKNQSRKLLPELSGSIAMTSLAAAIVIAAGGRTALALALPAILIARGVPTILYVRTLLTRAHGREASSRTALALHAAAAVAVASFAPLLATAAMVILLVRALVVLSNEPPRAQTLGWQEMALGLLTVALTAAGYLL